MRQARNMGIRHTPFCVFATLAALAVMMGVETKGEATGVGFREIGGVQVEEGAKTLSAKLMISPEGEFVKTGAGTLEVPMSRIDTSAPYSVTVAGGKLSMSGASAASSTEPPEVVRTKAAFWTDASELQEGDSVTVWSDKRADGEWSAVARYRNAPVETPPVVAVTNGIKGIYFGGKSGKWMRFLKDGADATLENVHHFFVVHGVFNWWASVLGKVGGMENAQDSRGQGILTSELASGGTIPFSQKNNDPVMFGARRGELDQRHFQARFYLDGRLVDPYSTSARCGFQLLEGDLLSAPSPYDAFYFNYFETYSGDVPGGDYICEAIFFTERLSETERLEVERYLMAKWNLPQTIAKDTANAGTASVALPRGTGTVLTAAGASVEVDVAEGAESVPLAFTGSGNAVKKGAGTLVVGASDSVPGTGTLSLEEGDVIIRGGAMPPVHLGAGEAWRTERHPNDARQKLNDFTDANLIHDLSSGLRVSKTATNGTAAIKSGMGELRATGLKEAVKRLVVAEGALNLSSRETPLAEIAPLCDEIEVYVPNHSFETPFDVRDYNRSLNMGAYSNEWHCLNESNYNKMQFVTLEPRIDAWTSYRFPDGTNALLLVDDAYAETEVTIPRAGEYEFTFFATSRFGAEVKHPESWGAAARSVVDVMFAGRAVGRCQVNKSEFVRFRYRFIASETETGVPVRLGFRTIRSENGNCMIIDDLHLRAVAVSARRDAVKVPNGDFEKSDALRYDGVAGIPVYLSRDMVADGWTFSLADGVPFQNPTNGFVAISTPGTPAYAGWQNQTPFFPFADSGLGAHVLAFVGKYGIAESAPFALPTGRWLLRGRIAGNPAILKSSVDSSDFDCRATPLVNAEIIRADGTECSLAYAHTPFCRYMSHLPKPCIWTNAIEVAESENVRVRLSSTAAGAGVTLDDLEFISADAALPELNLVPDPGFENLGRSWEAYVAPGGEMYERTYGTATFWNTTDTYAFGYAFFDGDCCGRLLNRTGVRTRVAFPAAGLYRLTMHLRPRADETSNHNPVFAFVQTDGGTTNEICRIDVPTVQNYIEYSRLFWVTAPGSHSLCIEGMGVPSGRYNDAWKDTADKTTLVDGVSVFKVDASAQLPPSIQGRVRIDVAEGAKLVLDYPGVVSVTGVTLGGVRIRGESIIDAKSHPEYVSGIGALRIVPHGSVMSIR